MLCEELKITKLVIVSSLFQNLTPWLLSAIWMRYLCWHITIRFWNSWRAHICKDTCNIDNNIYSSLRQFILSIISLQISTRHWEIYMNKVTVQCDKLYSSSINKGLSGKILEGLIFFKGEWGLEWARKYTRVINFNSHSDRPTDHADREEERICHKGIWEESNMKRNWKILKILCEIYGEWMDIFRIQIWSDLCLKS